MLWEYHTFPVIFAKMKSTFGLRRGCEQSDVNQEYYSLYLVSMVVKTTILDNSDEVFILGKLVNNVNQCYLTVMLTIVNHVNYW